MMGLADTLRLRAARQGRTAEVLCGALGSVTVEALPPRELELLRRGADSARAIFYAACRELQAAGEALHRTGEIYTPDGILQFVSQKEAEAAARAVLALSEADGTDADGEFPQEEAASEVQAAPLSAEANGFPTGEAADAQTIAGAGEPFDTEESAPAAAEDFPALWADIPFDMAPARAEHDSAGKTLRTDTLLTAAVQEVGTQQRQDLPDADAAARRLLEGLRMASRARGG